MTDEQKTMIRESFSQVAPIAREAAALFYGRLFELDPTLRPLFKGDIEEQGRKLMATLSFAVSNLANPGVLVPAVQALGARHVAYGVKDESYATVGTALLWTLGQGLGEAFTPAVRDAWTACFNTLAGVMKQAAAETRAI